MNVEILNEIRKLTKDPILAVIPYGSAIYGNKESIDFDAMIIVDSKEVYIQNTDVKSHYDFFVIDKYSFKNNVINNQVKELELIHTPLDKITFLHSDFLEEFNSYKSIPIKRELIRENFSQLTSNSYVKAKKKLILEKDFDEMVSLKSLWHSIRLLDFATQIINKNSIDYTTCNHLYNNIIEDYSNTRHLTKEEQWNFLHQKYRPIYNEYHSKLKLLCPKNNSVKP